MTNNRSNARIAAMVLAAGTSSRLGIPKQLISYKGQTLVQKAAEEAVGSGIEAVYVVGGAYYRAVADACGEIDCTMCFNDLYAQGVGTSISKGLSCILSKNPDVQAVLIVHADQPLVHSGHLQQLLQVYRTGRATVVASAYAGTFGVPVLVDRCYFSDLLKLRGDRGGKEIFKKHGDSIVTVPCEDAAVDIDTAEDLHRLTGSKGAST